MRSELDSKYLVTVLILLIIILLTEFLGSKFFDFGLLTHFPSLLIVIIVVLLYLLAIGYFTRKKLALQLKTDFDHFCNSMKYDFDEFTNSLKSDISKIVNSLEEVSINWLLTQNEINDIEKDLAKDMEIWIITPDLNNDTNLDNPQISEIIEIVKKNMLRGVRYTYIVPDKRSYVNAKIDELENIFESYKDTDKLVVKKVKNGLFSLLGNMCFVIYNPKSIKGKSSRVYLELPREEKKWWVELSKSQAKTFEGRIVKILEQTK